MTVTDYIRELLHSEDCVIVPNFGGFVGNYQEAKVNFKTQQVSPPSKKIAFNQKLQNDDGLLIKTIASRENIDYEAAAKKVQAFVKKMKASLEQGKSVKLNELGSFSKKKSVLVFNADNSVNYLRDAYGLDSFEFPLLETTSKQISKPRKTLTPVKKERRRPALVPLAVGLPIIAALIYAPFFFQEKAYENVFGKAGIEIPMGMDKRVIALNAADFDLERQALHSEPDETQASETDVEEPGETKTEETTPEPKTTAGEVSDEAEETKPVSTSADADLTGPYYIIGGSYRSEQNAGEAASQYESQGYTCRILHANNGNKRVAIQSYGSVEAAYQQLDQLRQATGREDLWIHRE